MHTLPSSAPLLTLRRHVNIGLALTPFLLNITSYLWTLQKSVGSAVIFHYISTSCNQAFQVCTNSSPQARVGPSPNLHS